MEGTNPNEIFQIEGGSAQNTKQINGQLTVTEESNKTNLE